MKAIAVLMTVVSLLAAACSDAAADSVAFLDSTTTLAPASDEESDATDEEALLAFATCMRDNGIEDFEDPTIDSDGRLQFGPGEGAQQESADREMMQAARNACQQHLEGLAIGPGATDRSEIEDQLYEFAACMRDNGYDMPDPDFSGSAGERGGGGPFGDGIDPEDLAFVSALEACEETFGGTMRFGRGRAGGGTP